MAQDLIQGASVCQLGRNAGLRIWSGAVHQGVICDEAALVTVGVVQVVERVVFEVHVGERMERSGHLPSGESEDLMNRSRVRHVYTPYVFNTYFVLALIMSSCRRGYLFRKDAVVD